MSKAHSLSPAAISAGSWSLTAGRHGAVGQRVDDPLDVALAQGDVTQPLGSRSREVLAVDDDPPGLAGGQAGFAVGLAVGSGVGLAVGSGVGSTVGAGVGSRVGVAAGVGGAGVTATGDGARGDLADRGAGGRE